MTNSKTQIVKKLKNSSCEEKTQKLKLISTCEKKNLKTQILTTLKKTQHLKKQTLKNCEIVKKL